MRVRGPSLGWVDMFSTPSLLSLQQLYRGEGGQGRVYFQLLFPQTKPSPCHHSQMIPNFILSRSLVPPATTSWQRKFGCVCVMKRQSEGSGGQSRGLGGRVLHESPSVSQGFALGLPSAHLVMSLSFLRPIERGKRGWQDPQRKSGAGL